MLQPMLPGTGHPSAKTVVFCGDACCEERGALGRCSLAAGHDRHKPLNYGTAQPGFPKLLALPYPAAPYARAIPSPNTSISRYISPWQNHSLGTVTAIFPPLLATVSLWTIFHGKEKGFPPPAADLVSTLPISVPTTVLSLLCCPAPPAQLAGLDPAQRAFPNYAKAFQYCRGREGALI